MHIQLISTTLAHTGQRKATGGHNIISKHEADIENLPSFSVTSGSVDLCSLHMVKIVIIFLSVIL